MIINNNNNKLTVRFLLVLVLVSVICAAVASTTEINDTIATSSSSTLPEPVSSSLNNDDNGEFPEMNDEARLLQTLLKRYHGYGLARPVSRVNKTLDVALLFVINEFLGIEELTASMKVTAVIIATWQDDLLRWNPDKYHQLRNIPMRTHDVFLPTIVKDGNGGTQSSIFMTGAGQNDRDINAMVWVSHTGQVEAKVTGSFVSSCNLNLDDFPFDSQMCRFVFKSWRFNNKRITIHQATDQKLTEEITDSVEVNINANANWVMSSITSRDTTVIGIGENFSAITYEVIATRRSDYYMWNVLMPSIAMAVLLLATFFMPFGPERSMFCITLVLTMNIFQQALNNKLPVTSEVIPYVRQTTVQVILGIGITLESAFVWWIASKNKRSAVPSWLRMIIPKLRSKMRQEKADAEALRLLGGGGGLTISEKKRFLMMENGRNNNNNNGNADHREQGDDNNNGNNNNNNAGNSMVDIDMKSAVAAGAVLSRRGSFGSRFGTTNNLSSIGGGGGRLTTRHYNGGGVEAMTAEEFEVWGEWLEVAQIIDMLTLIFTVSCMFGLPIFFYRHRLQ